MAGHHTVLAVYIRQAYNLEKIYDPYVVVECDGQEYSTNCLYKTSSPVWDELFLLDTCGVDRASIKFSLMDDKRFRHDVLIGKKTLTVRDVVTEPQQYRQRAQLELSSSGGQVAGTLEVQIFTKEEEAAEALSVLCCTWNVGNSQPPAILSSWLRGVDRGEHHIVAVASQECRYTVKRHSRKSKAHHKLPITSLEHNIEEPDRDPESIPITTSGSIRDEDDSSSTEDEDWPPQIAGTDHRGFGVTFGSRGRSSRSDNGRDPGHEGGEGQQHGAVKAALDVGGHLVESMGSFLKMPSIMSREKSVAFERQVQDNLSLESLSIRRLRNISEEMEEDGGDSMRGSSASRQTAVSKDDGPPRPTFHRPVHRNASLHHQGSVRSTLTRNSCSRRHDTYHEPRYKVKSTKVLRRLRGRMHRNAQAWEKEVSAAMGDHYWLMISRHMGQIRLLVFVRVDTVTAVDRKQLRQSWEATGFANVGTNKGAVGISMRLYNTDFAFISSHLAAHQDKVKARNNDYREALRGMRLDPYDSDVVTYPHHTFWMGDLNYRLDYGGQATDPTETPTEEDWKALVEEIDLGDFESLLKVDQLQKEIKEGRVLTGFREGGITFAPTFKMSPDVALDTDIKLQYSHKRSPAWTDRILVRSSLPHKQATIGEYFSAPEINTSDHKPVGCVFNVPLATLTIPPPPKIPHVKEIFRTATAELTRWTNRTRLHHFQVELSMIRLVGAWPEVTTGLSQIKLMVSGPSMVRPLKLRMASSGAGEVMLQEGAVAVLRAAPSVWQLVDERVLLKIEGSDAQGMSQILGRSVLPLYAAAHAGLDNVAPFEIGFMKHGIFAGTLEGCMRINKHDSPFEPLVGLFDDIKGRLCMCQPTLVSNHHSIRPPNPKTPGSLGPNPTRPPLDPPPKP